MTSWKAAFDSTPYQGEGPSLTSKLSLLLFVVVVLAHVSLAHAADSDRKQELLASFVLKFLDYTTFQPEPVGEFRLCFVGPTESLSPFDQIANRKVGAVPLSLFKSPSVSESKKCHALYLSGASYIDYLAATKSSSTLTIGIGSAFIDAGGIIALFEENNRIRFEVNLKAAQSVGITFNSRFLQLAKIRD